MSAINLKKLLDDYKIVIPKIQRDYAEGRETESVSKKRTNLLSDMLNVVYGKTASLSLDFVYGVKDNCYFLPLDGQQRLTTLFLLHWLFGRNMDIKDQSNHSRFVYETRKTSEEFCHWLVKQESTGIIEAWQKKVNEAKTLNMENKGKWSSVKNEQGFVDKIANRLAFPLVRVPSLFDYFTELDDFKWDWHIDPNIHSMIVVLETACDIITVLGRDLSTGIDNKDNLNNIQFEILSDLKCDGDVLFEKMNARGKALSSFDLLKSSLEEELEIQQSGRAKYWRKDIDNKWVDYCWGESKIPSNLTLDDVKRVESKLERLMIRMIGKSFFNTDINFTRNPNIETPGQKFNNCIFKDCDNVADNYFKYARYERLCNNSCMTKLNFEQIYKDINSLLYRDDHGYWKDISGYLHDNGLKMHADNENTLLDDFLGDTLNHDTRVIFYAMLAYLNRRNAEEIVSSKTEFSNFKDWMRFVRNVFLAANKNARIDKPVLVKKAIEAIDNWLKEFFDRYSKGQSGTEMLQFIVKYVKQNPNSQEEARLSEESIKADLRTSDGNWEAAIIEAESVPYLWGQVIAPLEWSKDEQGDYKIDRFKSYVEKIKALLAVNNIDIKLLQACIARQDYRLNGDDNWGSLGTMNDDRDISWKRHLRNEHNGIYGYLIKDLVDWWMEPLNSSLSPEELLEQVKSNKPNDWRFFICNLDCEEVIKIFGKVETSYRYIYNDNGTVYFYRSKQRRSDSIRYDIGLLYLYVKLKQNNVPEIKDANAGSYIKFKNASAIEVQVSSKPNGEYEISQGGTSVIVKSVNDLLNNIGTILP